MNCKILIISFLALCCIQLVLAEDKDQPRPRRGRSASRPRRSTLSSSKSLKKSPPLNPAIPGINFATTESSLPNDDKMKLLEQLNHILDVLDGGKPNAGPPENVNVAEGIPMQSAKKSTIIEGRDNKILVDGVVKYANAFSNGDVQIKIRDGNFYVNNNLVLRKGSLDSLKFIVYSRHTFDYKGVTWFTWEINPNGRWSYKDNKHGEAGINYYTSIYF
ncbi:uncharacterized protein LOC135848280 [Planococcus citri]|uniref:uncharacterized protein LOC135848280 n=1 Tax=Planococcus citri TaxID=170843 RepID=UPI0031F831C8